MGTAAIGIGCMVAGFIADAIGRKRSFYVTAFGSAIGIVIEATSGIGGARFWQLVAGKIVICMAIGVASVSVPLYLAECAPAPVRGAMVNSYVWIQCQSNLNKPLENETYIAMITQQSEVS
jgi:SP family sugar:H+ symporter-like MFS transporter